MERFRKHTGRLPEGESNVFLMTQNARDYKLFHQAALQNDGCQSYVPPTAALAVDR